MGALRALRVLSWPLSLLYGAAVRVRNLGYDRGWSSSRRVGARVVSVGNLTVGGSGKTPLVAWLVDLARASGLRIGVVARGYGRAPGAVLNDEGLLLAGRFPDLPQEQDPDRAEACERLLARSPLDVILLDDGFQHRRLRRDFDILCIDAERPFAQGMLLPAGDLREPVGSLRRADAVVITRASGLSEAAWSRLRLELVRFAGREIPVFAAEHEPLDLIEHPDRRPLPLELLKGRDVELLSAIARPDAFEATVRALGATIRAHHRHRDHHRHDPVAVDALAAAAAARGTLLLTTEKDAVKLSAVTSHFVSLRIAMRFLGARPTASEIGLR